MTAAILTPLLYLVVAASALWMAGRWLGPIPTRTALVLAMIPLCFTGRALLTGRVFAPIDIPFTSQPLAAHAAEFGIDEIGNRSLVDVAGQFIPWAVAVRCAWEHGEWPLRNPFSLTGDVLAGGAQAAPYDPLHVISLLVPVANAQTFQATSVFFLAVLGMFLYLRDLGCRDVVAMIASTGWALSGFMAFWVGYPMGAVVALLPFTFLAVRCVTRRPSLASATFLGGVFVLLILGGHPESTLHVVAIAAVYGAYELVAAEASVRARAAVLAGLAGVVALLLCAIYLLPIAETVPQTWEHHVRNVMPPGAGHQVSLTTVPLRAIPSLIPFALGVPSASMSSPTTRPWRMHPWITGYASSMLLAPALFGLWRSRWAGRWVVAGLGAFCLLAGASAPGATDLLARLPLFDVSLNHRLVFFVAFAVPVLAALGLEHWCSRPWSRSLGWLQLVMVALVGLVIASLWSRMESIGLSGDFLMQRTAIELVPVVAIGFILVMCRRPDVALGAFLAVLLAQRTAEAGATYPAVPVAAFFPMVAPLDELPRGDSDPYRIVGIGAVLPPNYATLYAIEDVRGNTPLTFRPFTDLYPLWCRKELWFNTVTSLDAAILSLLNVRFALAPLAFEPPAGWRVLRCDGEVQLLENSRVLGRAFVPEQVSVDEPPEQVPKRMAAARDFSRNAWVDTGRTPPARSPREQSNGPGSVSVTRVGLGYSIVADMAAAGWVVVSENAWSGWQARSGGRPIPLHRANHAFLAFHLGAGQHTVELRYLPRSFKLGAAVSAVTLLMLLVLWAVRLASNRKRADDSFAP